ncbi:hypothetical protein [Thalassospira sp. TSL5-1]|uniref:hypothetical protein n=1 Tax=Thalassospira sp. TSL5-1 TaxID=1544451 RepID=UPI00093B75AD|nr:hypothetical protein [Thalassospira sp. TSL5-1]OKH89513.1 hypothetical protein LF95_05985 [Thalassospira sp. TSL5-1]
MRHQTRGRMVRRGVAVAIIAGLAFSTLNGPREWLANLIWPEGPAPWEKVTAVYFPDKNDKTAFRFAGEDLGSLDQCRDAVMELAATNNDPELKNGSYDCAVGYYADDDHTGHYRLTLSQ